MNSPQPPPRSIKSEDDIRALIQNDPWRMKVLRAAQTLDLPDWWIGAGFVRNLVWNALEGKLAESTRDVDLVYFDQTKVQPETDWAYDEKLKAKFPFADWEVRNQARMHYYNDFQPYTSTKDGISHWTETATAIAVTLEGDSLRLLFCYGTDDLLNLIAHPTPHMQTPELMSLFNKRVTEKRWQEKWPHLQVKAS